ncbi:uncharacterized serine-rich protein C215.13-like [Lycium barbarum]|uniref:uncharacterized serine-rich protein C215.13-like n=1 Tax=Lycium barbarum TaxID=112863 RepID=UPI00293F304E|nr:uncharacterized serine-rich protein C215.13-like [Lycium barbarum]
MFQCCLSFQSSQDCVLDANPISYFLPAQSSPIVMSHPSGSTDDFSIMYPILDDDEVSENPSEPTLSLFPEAFENPSEPTFSLFQEASTVLSLSPPGTPDTSSTIISQDSSAALASSNNALGNCAPKRSFLISLSESGQVSENLAAFKPIANNNPPSSSTASLPSTDLCLSLPYTSDTSSTITTLHCSIGSQDSTAALASSSGNCATKRSLFQESNIRVRKESTNNPKRQRLISQPPPPSVLVEEYWITKKLTKSDVNGASRLLLPRQEVNTYILPFLDKEQQAMISQDGIDVTVLDLDTETEHTLTLKKWLTNSFQLIKAWTAEFVKIRNLKQDDVIAIRWDENNSRFCFRVPRRNQQVAAGV